MTMDLQAGIVYGPLQSRRLGRSLGINLAPAGRKTCNYNCAYCQYGWTDFPAKGDFPRPCDVLDEVDRALAQHPDVDAITVAGNGEPTLHPAFAPIADGLFALRNRHAPKATLTLLSNGSTLNRLDVAYSLARFDVRCMKLDAGDATTFRVINHGRVPLGRLISDLRYLGNVDLLSRFVRNEERTVDNTSPGAVDAWLSVVREINPRTVQICGQDWPSGGEPLAEVPITELEAIAARAHSLGIPAAVYR
jgi:wyosine [tRNA(Phe)-imidazoG37] synthetase (radical SAM superfamily)